MSKEKIKIAIVAPPFGETGGPEVVVKNLSEALTELGVDVTLFAPADWKVKCKHVATLKQSLWNMKNFTSQNLDVRRNLILESQLKVLSHQQNFNLIHCHFQKYAYLIARFSSIPCLVSLHNLISIPEYKQLKETKMKIIFLSRSQKGKKKGFATIKNGIQIAEIKPCFKKEKYLIAIGRLCERKGIDEAIKIALAAKRKLIIFGRVGNSEKRQKYFKEKIKPFLDDKNIIYKGSVSQGILFSYLKKAEALLFAIPEPDICPLTIMESLAFGTPIIGTKIDPLPELIGNNPKVAFLSNNFSSLVKIAKDTSQFDNQLCREYAEKNFDRQVMAKKYLEIYQEIIK